MSKKILIPSEMLEPVVTKTIAEIFEHFALEAWTYEQMLERLWSLSHFVDNCGAIHCSLALTNTIGMVLSHKDNRDELRKNFKETLDKHTEENL